MLLFQGAALQDSAWEFSQSQIIGPMNQSNSGATCEMKEKSAYFVGSYVLDKFDNSSDLATIDSMAKNFEQILKKKFCENEKNPLALLHKNLWIEAHVKLFSMKYELQLARTELEILNRNQHAKGFAARLQEATRNLSLDSWLDSQASRALFDAGESSRSSSTKT